MAYRDNFATRDEHFPTGILPIDMNTEELNELFAACLPKLKRAARKMLRNPQDSEDALQEALLSAFRKLHQFQGRSSFLTWVHSIVLNTSRMYYRKAKAHPVSSMETDFLNEAGSSVENAFADRQPTPEEAFFQQERSQILTRATEELPDRYHPAIYLFYRRGLGEEATANALGMTVSALKAQLYRSRHLLSGRIRQTHMPSAPAELLSARPILRRRSVLRTASRPVQTISARPRMEAIMQ